MHATDILTTIRHLEDSGMNRTHSEAIAESIIAAVEPLATKNDLKALEERMEERMASKDDLKALEERMEERMATKDDLKALEGRVEERFERMEERMATKNDLELAVRSIKIWWLGSLITFGLGFLAIITF